MRIARFSWRRLTIQYPRTKKKKYGVARGSGKARIGELALSLSLLLGIAVDVRVNALQPNSKGARTGVLVHGYHLGAKGWRDVMWGDEKQQKLGRLPHAVRVAWEENACLVVVGTGASEQDGLSESRYTLEYLERNWHALQDFDTVFGVNDVVDIKKSLQPILVAEEKSLNTREELVEAGRLFRQAGCTRVVLVSSPTHTPRCLRDACILWRAETSQDTDGLAPGTPTRHQLQRLAETTTRFDEDGADAIDDGRDSSRPRRQSRSAMNIGQTTESTFRSNRGPSASLPAETVEVSEWRPVILASPSDTSYADYGPGDVTIIEPPHRGDDSSHSSSSNATQDDQSDSDMHPVPMLHELASRALRVMQTKRSTSFRRDLDSLLRQYMNPQE